MLSKQKSVTLVQRAFIRTLNKAPPYENNVQRRSKKVVSTESVKKQSWPGRTTLLNQSVENIRLSCICPKTIPLFESLNWEYPVSPLPNILDKRIHLQTYKIQLHKKSSHRVDVCKTSNGGPI